MNWASFWPNIGEIALAFALATALFTIVTAVIGEKQKKWRMVQVAERSLYTTMFLILIAAGILLYCLLTDNFLVRYVYGYSNTAMPIIYKCTALWGGQDGSLLFWVMIAAIFGSLATFTHRESDKALIPYAMATFGFIISFFLILLLFSDNPFRLFPQAPPDGRGLNPLLQNPSMAIHPPSLYLGYVGMTVPFAFAMSALISNRLDSRWIVATRIWLLISWFFLSVGNLLGAQWAYVELGWGGFWAWDPVENAAIMPWFTASAFLHSVMIQEKRGMLKFWNMNLIVISFCLTILGTFLTRSGIVQSVHSFARSEIGYYFVAFLIVVVLFSAFWIYKRRNELKSENIFESFLSKESAFVLNNIVLVGIAFIILWCTLFPTASEVIIGTRIIVGPPFFNKMLAPFALLLLVLTGIGPLIGWRKASGSSMKFHFLWPLICGLVAAGGTLLLRVTHWYVVVTIFGAAFVLVTIITEFVRGTLARMIQHQESWGTALIKSTFKNNRKYGGYIVHLGIVLILIGVAGTAYKEVYEFELTPGQTATIKEYTIHFKDFDTKKNANQEETYAVLDLYVGNQYRTTVRPARFYYFQPEQPTTEVDLYSRVKEDVYFTIGQVDPATGKTTIHMTLNPLISLLWFGGLVLVFGSLIAMLPPLRSQKKK
ncbi:MAG: ccmF [Bacteriovoracaceae bacterium]|nr:ccmF [Bacteriovoracaceae bacterium]